jgi:2-oxoglutarate dehydrogenase E1 component
MDSEAVDFGELEGVSPSFVEALYRQYAAEPDAVESGWRRWFEGLEQAVSGPSWARPNWPPTETDPLTAGLDPTQMAVPPKAAKPSSAAAAVPVAPEVPLIRREDVIRSINESIRAMMLIRTYRVRGHLAADLDPLGIYKRELPADLTPEYHGFTANDLDRPIYLGGALGLQQASVKEIVRILRRHRIYAHRRRGGAALPPGADGGQGQGDPVHARGQEGDPLQGDRGRAVGEVPRPQICRHQALRPRRR